METIELYEALKTAAHDDQHSIGNYELPVKVGNDIGTMPLLQVFDQLVSYGNVTHNSLFCVEFESDEDGEVVEDWHRLDEIEITGSPMLL